MTNEFHRFWLKITAVVIGSFGPVFFLGTMAPTLAPARLTLDLLGWRLSNPSNHGVPSNATFNILVLLLAVGPLWRPARA